MIGQSNTDIVRHVARLQDLPEPLEVLTLIQGQVLVFAQRHWALYQSEAAINDPLGNGLIAIADLPPHCHLDATQTRWATHCEAGFIGLNNGCAALILPAAIRLYACREDALHNRDLASELAIA